MKIRFSLHSRHASACQQLPLWLPSTTRPRKQAVLFKTWMTGTKLCKQKQESKFLTEAFHLFHWPLVAESSHGHPTNTPHPILPILPWPSRWRKITRNFHKLPRPIRSSESSAAGCFWITSKVHQDDLNSGNPRFLEIMGFPSIQSNLLQHFIHYILQQW